MIKHSGAAACGDLLQALREIRLSGCPIEPVGGVIRRLRHGRKVSGESGFGKLRGLIASPWGIGVLLRTHEMACAFADFGGCDGDEFVCSDGSSSWAL